MGVVLFRVVSNEVENFEINSRGGREVSLLQSKSTLKLTGNQRTVMSTGFPLYPKRDFSPYAVDGCDVRFESPRSSHSDTSLLTKPPRDSDDEKGHQYEDPAVLSDQVRVLQEGGKRPRKRFNDMYEPHIPLKNLKELRVRRSTDESDESDLSDTYTRESCLNRCILFFVLLTSVTALILVVLLILGKVGPTFDRCVCNAEQGNTQGKTTRSVDKHTFRLILENARR